MGVKGLYAFGLLGELDAVSCPLDVVLVGDLVLLLEVVEGEVDDLLHVVPEHEVEVVGGDVHVLDAVAEVVLFLDQLEEVVFVQFEVENEEFGTLGEFSP